MRYVNAHKKGCVQLLQPVIDEVVAGNAQGYLLKRVSHNLNSKRSLQWRPASKSGAGQQAISVWVRDQIRFGLGTIIQCDQDACLGDAPTVKGHCGTAWVDHENAVYFVHMFGDQRGSVLRNGGIRPGMWLDGVTKPKQLDIPIENMGFKEVEWDITPYLPGMLSSLWSNPQVEIVPNEMDETKLRDIEAKQTRVQEDVCMTFMMKGSCDRKGCGLTHIPKADFLLDPKLEKELEGRGVCISWYSRGKCNFGPRCRFSHVDRKVINDFEIQWRKEHGLNLNTSTYSGVREGYGKPSSGQRKRPVSMAEDLSLSGIYPEGDNYGAGDIDYYDYSNQPFTSSERSRVHAGFERWLDDRAAGPQTHVERESAGVSVNCTLCPQWAVHSTCTSGKACAMIHSYKPEMVGKIIEKLKGSQVVCPKRTCSLVGCPFVHARVKYDDMASSNRTIHARRLRKAKRDFRRASARLEDYDSDDDSGNEIVPEGLPGSFGISQSRSRQGFGQGREQASNMTSY
jgi:hypothetical protein